MSRHSHIIPVLIVSLLLISHLLPLTGAQPAPAIPARVQNLRGLTADISRIRFSFTCPVYLQTSRRALRSTLERACACRRNDLPQEQFEFYLARCRRGNREALEELCAVAPPACMALRLIRDSCAKIGRTRATRRFCARKGPLRAFLEDIVAMRCPTPDEGGAMGLEGLAERSERLARDIRRDAGLSGPAYGSRVVEALRGPPNSVVVLLHRRGGRAGDWESVIDLARGMGFSGTRFIALEAPMRFVDGVGGVVSTWLDEGNVGQVERGARNVANVLNIQNAVYGIPFNRMAVYGSGEGGALALSVYLRHRVGAVVSNGGFLPIAETYPEALTDESRNAPALVQHGIADEVSSIGMVRRSVKAMIGFGRNVTFVELEGEGHLFERASDFVVEQSLVFVKRSIRA